MDWMDGRRKRRGGKGDRVFKSVEQGEVRVRLDGWDAHACANCARLPRASAPPRPSPLSRVATPPHGRAHSRASAAPRARFPATPRRRPTPRWPTPRRARTRRPCRQGQAPGHCRRRPVVCMPPWRPRRKPPGGPPRRRSGTPCRQGASGGGGGRGEDAALAASSLAQSAGDSAHQKKWRPAPNRAANVCDRRLRAEGGDAGAAALAPGTRRWLGDGHAVGACCPHAAAAGAGGGRRALPGHNSQRARLSQASDVAV
eukprot:355353-Chlamydomonas_euryale.AAC.3